MTTSPIFADYNHFSAPWEIPFITIAVLIAFICAVLLSSLNLTRSSKEYDPQRAWLRAILYFDFCFIVSWLTGVFPMLLSEPIAHSSQLNNPTWIFCTGLLLCVVFVCYAIFWREGTVSNGRPLVWFAVIPFGIIWGLATGQMLLSIWALLERTGLQTTWIAVGTLLFGGMVNGFWHSKYWDINVAPDHNIVETNMRKILLAHIPNLGLSLGHLVLFSNPSIFVVSQVIALGISAVVMHFPPFWGLASACVPQHKPEGRPLATICVKIS